MVRERTYHAEGDKVLDPEGKLLVHDIPGPWAAFIALLLQGAYRRGKGEVDEQDYLNRHP